MIRHSKTNLHLTFYMQSTSFVFSCVLYCDLDDLCWLQKCSPQKTLFVSLIKAAQGRLTDFRCISVMDTFMICQTQCFPHIWQTPERHTNCFVLSLGRCQQSFGIITEYPDVFCGDFITRALISCTASHLCWQES